MSRLQRFQLLTKEEAANSPSFRDGVPPNMEYRRRKLAAQHLRAVIEKLKMPINTWAIAVTFFNRFYARKSMKKNNTFIIACASLFLASKVDDSPNSHMTFANEMLKAWFGRDNPQLQKLAAQQPLPSCGSSGSSGHQLPPFWVNMHAAVLEAERALLYTLGFDFNIDIIHTHIARLLKRPRFQPYARIIPVQQYALNMSNDIYKLDGMLPLEYPMEKIAVAIYYLVFKQVKKAGIHSIPQPAPGANGVHWYVEEGLSVTECVELTNRLLDRLYGEKTKQAAAQQAAAAAAQHKPGMLASARTGPVPSTTGAASTVMLGACESAAYSGGGYTALFAAGRSEMAVSVGGGGGDTAGEHTSLPQPPLSDEVAAPAVGNKRPAPGAASGGGAADDVSPSSKRARPPPAAAAAGASHEVTSMAVPPTVYAKSWGNPSPLPRLPAAGVTPGAGSTNVTPTVPLPAPPAQPAAAAACPAVAAAAAAAAADDSEKEEGELEEGELC